MLDRAAFEPRNRGMERDYGRAPSAPQEFCDFYVARWPAAARRSGSRCARDSSTSVIAPRIGRTAHRAGRAAPRRRRPRRADHRDQPLPHRARSPRICGIAASHRHRVRGRRRRLLHRPHRGHAEHARRQGDAPARVAGRAAHAMRATARRPSTATRSTTCRCCLPCASRWRSTPTRGWPPRLPSVAGRCSTCATWPADRRPWRRPQRRARRLPRAWDDFSTPGAKAARRNKLLTMHGIAALQSRAMVSIRTTTCPILSQPQPPAAPRRPRRWLGTLIAVASLALLAALAWYLTHRPAATPVAGALPPGGIAAGGPRGGAAFGGGRGGALPSTVAVVRARRADVPVLLDALGTVTPAATVTVRPQVSGVLTQVLFTEGQMVTQGPAAGARSIRGRSRWR